MDQPMRDFTDLLLRRGVVSLDQLSEATNLARDSDLNVADALIK
jgi:type IV pilus assembly protein PilB